MRYRHHRPLPRPSNSNYDRQPPFTNKKSFDHRSVINDAEFNHAIDLTQTTSIVTEFIPAFNNSLYYFLNTNHTLIVDRVFILEIFSIDYELCSFCFVVDVCLFLRLTDARYGWLCTCKTVTNMNVIRATTHVKVCG